ncbi:hypothetical protein LIER_33015 [Lithospermum erythrorhizon]|uniref:Uncharacterized protein n=1 Tax=Lithospermum erythrorhizon TaxID=34254 RepID=A0AAV3RZE2_LITER
MVRIKQDEIGPRPSILGPHPSNQSRILSNSSSPISFNTDVAIDFSKSFSQSNIDSSNLTKVYCPSSNKRSPLGLDFSDEDLYFRGPRPHKKRRWSTIEMLDIVDARVDVQVLEKVNNMNMFVEAIRPQKRVWDCGDSTNEMLV